MTSSPIDRANLDFLLFDWLRLGDFLGRGPYEEHSLETASAFLDLAERLSGDYFLPHYKASDNREPRLTTDGVDILPEACEAVRQFAQAGFIAAPFAGELGGMRVPETLHAAAFSFFMAANISTSAYPMLTIASARLLAAYGAQRQIEAFAAPQIAGEAMGTMCLSEPQAGSSLAHIRTRAVFEEQTAFGERFRLFGNKMWISGGDHDITQNIFHLVLAKIADGNGGVRDGTADISLFLAPKWLVDEKGDATERNDVVVAGLNHKMGYRGTSNCLLNFGEGARYRPEGKAGAIGYLIGARGGGLATMFHMMNEARIAVGLGAAAIASRSHRLSVDYARERVQGRGPAGPCPIIEHPDVKRLLMRQKCYAEGALSLVLMCARLADERAAGSDQDAMENADKLLSLLTPVAKTWSSERGVSASDIAIQIHGGYGYTRDFDVEQLYRDNRLNPIHEGTTGIQGVDFVLRKLARDDGALKLLQARLSSTCQTAKQDARLAKCAIGLRAAWDEFLSLAARLETADSAALLSNATAILDAFGDIVVGWLWLDQAAAAFRSTRAEAFSHGKLAACLFFHDVEIPAARARLSQAGFLSRAVADIPAAAFS
ncbi:MAG: acyl-CoA dehydrogenase C-terminal domain-containing protein [Rhizobiales bacterium]|nr:acyl-CoA dehydrogenase C-terminal domain-containing protein [Hyphomicrobiales bacterium]